MLKAKLDAARKNKKGFSLIELIIVVAIMVALIAVLAPSYVKYVQKSRDAALTTAAEDLATAVKTYYADPECPVKCTEGTIVLKVSDKKLNITATDINGWASATEGQSILEYSGIDSTKSMGATSLIYTLNVASSGKVTITSATAAA